MLVPFFVIMVLESRRKRPIREEEDEEVGYSGFDENPEEEYAEEEGESGEHEATDTPIRQEQSQTPLWKYVQRQEGGKGGGTTKFCCPHCNKEYTGSYTRARRHLCGKMPGDGDKNLGIKICVSVPATEREREI